MFNLLIPTLPILLWINSIDIVFKLINCSDYISSSQPMYIVHPTAGYRPFLNMIGLEPCSHAGLWARIGRDAHTPLNHSSGYAGFHAIFSFTVNLGVNYKCSEYIWRSLTQVVSTWLTNNYLVTLIIALCCCLIWTLI